MNKKLILSLVIILGIAIAGYLFLGSTKNGNKSTTITTFEECVNAGNPIMESDPRQCRTASGELFIENKGETPRFSGGCFIGGCSGQICSEDPEAMSTCEFRAEYACYQTATCERQVSGECGWTETLALNACLNAGIDGK